jgi:hypothetical protein
MLFTGSRRATVDPLESVSAISQSMLALVTTLQAMTSDAGSPDGGVDQDLARWGQSLGTPAAAPATLRLALSTWYRVHGLVSLEIVGAFDTMGLDGERLLAAEVDGLVREAARA